MLANYTYDIQPVPLKGEAEYDPDLVMSEMSGDEEDDDDFEDEAHDEEESDQEMREHLIKFPKHSQFLLKFRNAKIAADRSKKKTFVYWRGHKTSISPNAPIMTYTTFKDNLIQALRNVKEVTVAEAQVKKKCRNVNRSELIFFLYSFLGKKNNVTFR